MYASVTWVAPAAAEQAEPAAAEPAAAEPAATEPATAAAPAPLRSVSRLSTCVVITSTSWCFGTKNVEMEDRPRCNALSAFFCIDVDVGPSTHVIEIV